MRTLNILALLVVLCQGCVSTHDQVSRNEVIGRIEYEHVFPRKIGLPIDAIVESELREAAHGLPRRELIDLLVWCGVRFRTSSAIGSLVDEVAKEYGVFTSVNYLISLKLDNMDN